MDSPNRKDYLERLILGLEQTAENLKFELQYYKPDDLQLRYVKKFLASVEENLAKARKDLKALKTAADPGEPPPNPPAAN